MEEKRSLGIIIFIMIILVATLSVTPTLLEQQPSHAIRDPIFFRQKAPVAMSGNNIYVTWSTNQTANHDGEVMFRASTDGGKIFGDKINLSNNSKTNSVDTEIAASGNDVVVSWWEHNQTASKPVLRTSNDNGKTFGPILKLNGNGAIDSIQ
jgi:hypothetical protein